MRDPNPSAPSPPGPEAPSVWEAYRLSVEVVMYQDSRRWTLMGHFVVFQGILLGAIFTAKPPWAAHFLVAFLGLVATGAWAFFLGKNKRYLDKATLTRTQLEARLDPRTVSYPKKGERWDVWDGFSLLLWLSAASWMGWLVYSGLLWATLG